jgi:glycosyltransferase involved in cell wall biosynthesis
MAVAGAEVLVHDFVTRAQPGLEQSIVTLDDLGPLGEALRARGLRVECVGRRAGVDPGLPFRLSRALARMQADVVHAHQYTPYFYSALACRMLPRRPGLIFTEHGRHVPDRRRPKRVLFNQLALSWTTRVTAVCAYVKRLLVANEGIAADRIEVVYNGVDATRFRATTDGTAMRRALGLNPATPLVACIARFHPVKDHPTLLRGFARTVRRVPEARLLLVGAGPGESALRALVEELRLVDRVLFTGVREDIPALLAACDLFAMTSLSEGTSVTLLEAMLSARAAVVTEVGGNPEIVSDGQTGLLVPCGDAEAAGEAMAALLLDRERGRAFGQAARERALGMFSQERMHAAWRRLYADAAPLGVPAARAIVTRPM